MWAYLSKDRSGPFASHFTDDDFDRLAQEWQQNVAKQRAAYHEALRTLKVAFPTVWWCAAPLLRQVDARMASHASAVGSRHRGRGSLEDPRVAGRFVSAMSTSVKRG